METTKQPYEFLVRWDQDGNLQGAHIQYRYVVRGDDGAVITETLGPAEPVAAGAFNKGFPLKDVIGKAAADALATVNAQGAALKLADRTHRELRRSHEHKDEQLRSARSELTELRAVAGQKRPHPTA